MSNEVEDGANQSTKDFLFSKEGRPMLIGTLVLIVVFGTIMFWVYGQVFGSPESQPTAENLASSGGGNVRVSRDAQLQGDPTSPNLTEEAQTAVMDYNRASGTDDKLHPVPTFEDVEEIPLIPVANNDAVEAEAQTESTQNPDALPQFTYEPPALPSNQNGRQAARRGAAQSGGQGPNGGQMMTAEQVERQREYQRTRMEAARRLVEVYQEPPANDSQSFYSPRTAEEAERREAGQSGQNLQGPAGTQQVGLLANGAPSSQIDENACAMPLVKAGEIRYANNDIALNTDFQGPLRMTFLDGDLKGWMGMGSFELNEFGARMKARITTLIGPEGQQLGTSGYVLDQETTLWAVASDVDRHIIYRYGGFGLGTILSGFSEIADAREKQSEQIRGDGTTNTTYREPDGKQITLRVLGEFSRLWETAFLDNMNRPITVTLDPNVQVGVLFENTVCKPAGNELTGEVNKWRADGRSDPVLRDY